MTVQRLKKSRSFCRCFPVGVLCALSMIAFNSATAAQETAVPGNGGGQQSDTVRPKLVYDGHLTVSYNGYDIKLYRGIRGGQTDSSTIHRDTPYFHEPLIHFRKDANGRLKHTINDNGNLTLYVAMNILERQTLEAVKVYLQESKDVSEDDLPLDANIQPLSARGWFQSSANEDIRTRIGDVTMSSRTGQDILVHFPMSTPDAAASFLSRLHADEEQLTFKYSLQGDAIEVCTVDASGETMINHHRFQELAGDASGDGRYVSRDQIADLMSQISRHETISSNCRTDSVAKELRDKALERLEAEVDSGFTIDHLDGLTNTVQDDIRADIDTASKRIQAKEQREQIQHLSQQVRSGATTFGLFVKAIVEAIPFTAQATVDMSHASGEAYQFMWDSLSRVHNQLEWTGTAYRPKRVDVYRKEQLRNALNTSIQFRHEIPVFAKDIRSIPIPKANWIPDDMEVPSSVSTLEALSARLVAAQETIETLMEKSVAAQETIETLMERVEAPRLGTDPRARRPGTGVWAKRGNLRIFAAPFENDFYSKGNVDIRAEGGGDVDIRAEGGGDVEIKGKYFTFKSYSNADYFSRKDIAIEAGDDLFLASGNSGEIRMTSHDKTGVTSINLRADQILVNGQSLMDYVRERY